MQAIFCTFCCCFFFFQYVVSAWEVRRLKKPWFPRSSIICAPYIYRTLAKPSIYLVLDFPVFIFFSWNTTFVSSLIRSQFPLRKATRAGKKKDKSSTFCCMISRRCETALFETTTPSTYLHTTASFQKSIYPMAFEQDKSSHKKPRRSRYPFRFLNVTVTLISGEMTVIQTTLTAQLYGDVLRWTFYFVSISSHIVLIFDK